MQKIFRNHVKAAFLYLSLILIQWTGDTQLSSTDVGAGAWGHLGQWEGWQTAKKGTDIPFTGPEPVLGLPYSVVKRAIRDWMERKHIEGWKSSIDSKHSKALMEGPQQSRDTKLLSMSRQQLFVVIGLLTGHFGLYVHSHKIGEVINPLCRRCLNSNETAMWMWISDNVTGCIFGKSFGELQQLSHVPVDLFRWFATEIGPYRPRYPESRPITTNSCCLLMLSSLVALLCWGPSMRALVFLQSLLDFQPSMCFLSIQSLIACWPRCMVGQVRAWVQLMECLNPS